MDHALASILLFVTFSQWAMSELVSGLLEGLTVGVGVHLVFVPTILSGALALVVKHLAVTRLVPMYKLASGGLLAVLVSWYIDRICRNNAFLLVRAVGVALLFWAAAGVVIVSEGRYPVVTFSTQTGTVTTAAADEHVIGRD